GGAKLAFERSGRGLLLGYLFLLDGFTLFFGGLLLLRLRRRVLLRLLPGRRFGLFSLSLRSLRAVQRLCIAGCLRLRFRFLFARWRDDRNAVRKIFRVPRQEDRILDSPIEERADIGPDHSPYIAVEPTSGHRAALVAVCHRLAGKPF